MDVNKAHGHDNISVRLIKLCTNSVTNPLTLIFRNSMAAGKFATQWKRANIAPIHKKNDKQIVSNYRPVSLLLIWSNIFEKLIFNELFKFLRTKICFLNIKWVIARMNHVFINYLQSLMTLKFLTLETRGVFLDISYAFDRVWHDGLFKLKQNG